MSARAGIAAALLLAVGALNLLPGVLALAPSRARALYGIELTGDSLVLLMRHRAVLLALLGALLVVSAFRRAWRAPAIAAAVASKLAFLALFATGAAITSEIARVATLDAIALALLAVAAWLTWSNVPGSSDAGR